MSSLSTLLALCNLFMVITEIQAGAGSSWGYFGEHNPDTWHEEYYHCGGKKQSPINIVTDDVILNPKLGDFDMSGYEDTITDPILENTGHSAQINITDEVYLEGGGLPAKYKAEQFHFHWGADDSRGSEHTIDGQRLPMEIHIVHYSTEYASMTEALNKPDGLAVLGAFFEIVEESNPNFEHIVNHFTEPLYMGETLEIEDFELRSLLPDNLDTYWRYSGSLTTPPCYESVVWTFFKEHVRISEEQLDKFRHYLKVHARGEPDVSLVDDFRPIQPLNVRLVETNSEEGLSPGQNFLKPCQQMLRWLTKFSRRWRHFVRSEEEEEEE